MAESHPPKNKSTAIEYWLEKVGALEIIKVQVNCNSSFVQCLQKLSNLLQKTITKETKKDEFPQTCAFLWAYVLEIMHVLNRNIPFPLIPKLKKEMAELHQKMLGVVISISNYELLTAYESRLINIMTSTFLEMADNNLYENSKITNKDKKLAMVRAVLVSYSGRAKRYPNLLDPAKLQSIVDQFQNIITISGLDKKEIENKSRAVEEDDIESRNYVMLVQADNSLMKAIEACQEGAQLPLHPVGRLHMVVLHRVLQVIGERLKSQLPDWVTKSLLDRNVPIEALSRIRNVLSHSTALMEERRQRFLKSGQIYAVLVLLQADLQNLCDTLGRTLFLVRKEQVISLLNQIPNKSDDFSSRVNLCQDLQEISSQIRKLGDQHLSLSLDLAQIKVEEWLEKPTSTSSEPDLSAEKEHTFSGFTAFVEGISTGNTILDSDAYNIINLEFLLDQLDVSIFHRKMSSGTIRTIKDIISTFPENWWADDKSVEELFEDKIIPILNRRERLISKNQDIKKGFGFLGYFSSVISMLKKTEDSNQEIHFFNLQLILSKLFADHGEIKRFAKSYFTQTLNELLPQEGNQNKVPKEALLNHFHMDGPILTHLYQLIDSITEALDDEEISNLVSYIDDKVSRHNRKMGLLEIVSSSSPDQAMFTQLASQQTNPPLKAKDCKSAKTEVQSISDPFGKYLTEQKTASTCDKIYKAVTTFLSGGNKKSGQGNKKNADEVGSCVNQKTLHMLHKSLEKIELENLIRIFTHSRFLLIRLLINMDFKITTGTEFVGGVTREERENAKKKFESSSNVRYATEYLLLKLSDTVKHMSHLVSGGKLEDLMCRLRTLEASALHEHFLLRNYLAHGDFHLDTLSPSVSSAILDNALDFLEKGDVIIRIITHLAGNTKTTNTNKPHFQRSSSVTKYPFAEDILHKIMASDADSLLFRTSLEQRYGAGIFENLFQREILGAVRDDNISRFCSLLQNNEKTIVPDITMKGLSLLHFSVLYDSKKVFNWILTHENDLRPFYTNYRISPLHLAVLREIHDSKYFIRMLVSNINNSGDVSLLLPGEVITCFQLATFLKDFLLMKFFLTECGCDVDGGNNNFEFDPPIIIAAKMNDSNVLHFLLKSGAKTDVWMPTKGYRTPLHIFAGKGNLEAVEMLVDAGTDTNITVHDHTPLDIAIYEGHLDIVKCLIEAGAKIDSSKVNQFASASKNRNMVSVLSALRIIPARTIDQSSEDEESSDDLSTNDFFVDYANEFKLHPGDLSCLESAINGRLNVVQQLYSIALENEDYGDLPGIDRNLLEYPSMKSKLWDELEYGSSLWNAGSVPLELLVDLIAKFQKGVPFHQVPGVANGTLQFLSCLQGNTDVLKYHVTNNVALNQVQDTETGITPLMVSSANGVMNIVQFYLNELSLTAEDLGQVDNDNMTYLHHACLSGQIEIVRFILHKFPNFVSNCGCYCPVRASLESDHGPVASLIVSHIKSNGMLDRFQFQTSETLPIYHQAVLLGEMEFLEAIASQFPPTQFSYHDCLAVVNIRYKSTPLQWAAELGRWNLVSYLIENLDCNFKNADGTGETPLMRAINQENEYMIRYLLTAKNQKLTNNDILELVNLVVNSTSAVCLKFILPNVRHKRIVKQILQKSLSSTGPLHYGDTLRNKITFLWDTYSEYLDPNQVIGRLLREIHYYRADVDFMQRIVDSTLPHELNICQLLSDYNYSDNGQLLKILLAKSNFACLTAEHDCVDMAKVLEVDLNLFEFLCSQGAKIGRVDRDKLETGFLALLEKSLSHKGTTLSKSQDEVMSNLLWQVGTISEYRSESLQPLGCSLLHVAAYCSLPRTVAALITLGYSVNDWNDDDRTPFHYALQTGNPEVCQPFLPVLQNCEEDRNFIEEFFLEDYAKVLFRSEKVTKFFLNEGALDLSYEIEDRFGNTLFLDAIEFHAPLNVVRVLVSTDKKLVNVFYSNTNGQNALHLAFKQGQVEIASYLLEEFKFSVNTPDNDFVTPLHYAVRCGTNNGLSVQLLLDFGANANEVVTKKKSAMRKIMSRFTKKKTKSANRFCSILILAIRNRASDAVSVLLKYGADLEYRWREGMTPLILASRIGHVDIVKSLLSHGGNILATDENGNTALHYAAKRGDAELVGALLKSIVDSGSVQIYSVVNVSGNTVLHMAAMSRKLNYNALHSVAMFIEAGAGISMEDKNKKGETPPYLALYWRNVETAKILRQFLESAGKSSDTFQSNLIQTNEEERMEAYRKLKMCIIGNDLAGCKRIVEVLRTLTMHAKHQNRFIRLLLQHDATTIAEYLFSTATIFADANNLDSTERKEYVGTMKEAVGYSSPEMVKILLNYGASWKIVGNLENVFASPDILEVIEEQEFLEKGYFDRKHENVENWKPFEITSDCNADQDITFISAVGPILDFDQIRLYAIRGVMLNFRNHNVNSRMVHMLKKWTSPIQRNVNIYSF